MSVRIIFPPRPKSKMLPSELSFYEKTDRWLAQRKFRGSRAVLHISKDRKVMIGNRHGNKFANFSLDKSYRSEILDGLCLKDKTEYWLDGELMNKDKNSTFELILFDVLQVGRYFIGDPDQATRLQILDEICGHPHSLSRSGIALEVTPRIWMAEVFTKGFMARFQESVPIAQLEGLVLRKRSSSIDSFGHHEYETMNMIRCRKPFMCETPKEKRSGGYEF